jgi:cytochrome c peroxidase
VKTLMVAALVIPLGLDLYMPIPEANPLTVEKIDLGRRLFNDRRLSRDGTTACASCHDPARAFSVDRAVASGVFGRVGRRNAPALLNRGYGRLFFWDGRSRSLEDQVLQPIQDPNEMDLTLADAADRTGVDATTMSQALASYVRSILSGDSPYDRFVAGDREALPADALAGMRIFRGRGNCSACHIGPNFSDEHLHNTGVAWRDGRLIDSGAGHGEFKTPTLREVARTSPYMHDGSLTSLEQVVDYYDRGGNTNPRLDPELRALGLSNEDKRNLVAFLRALSGHLTEGELVR